MNSEAKKEWQTPVLEELQVQLTAASTIDGPFTDEAYVPGQPAQYYHQPRMSS